MNRILLVARVSWLTLPVTAGTSIDALLDGRRAPSVLVVTSLAFVAWFIGTVALLTPRPRSFTALRLVAPAAVSVALIATLDQTDAVAVLGLAHSILAAATSLSPAVADACADGASYGRERRHPLRLPSHIKVVAVPVAVASTILGIATGPLLLADGQWVFGSLSLVLGFCLAAFAMRSLIGLERRFIVLVPAGLVISDSLVLVDPVLFPTEHIAALRPDDDTPAGLPGARPGVLDLRLGAIGALQLVADEPATIACRQGRTENRTTEVVTVLFAPLRRSIVLDGWRRRFAPE